MGKIKVDIFSGFLGAGKTTLIKKLIKECLYKENIVIIENEFGEVGIDGSLFRKTNVQVKEVNAGCICCSIAGDFKKALIEVIEKYKPERIIIEPSGVAKLSEVVSACRTMELQGILSINMIITVADVLKFNAYSRNFGEFYKNQIINGKTIVLSRTQSIHTEKLISIKEEISNLNKSAVIVTTPWDKLSGEKIIELAQGTNKTSLDKEVNLIKKPITSFSVKGIKEHRGQEVFQSLGIETPKKFNFKTLQDRLKNAEDSSEYGSVLRAKGIVQGENNEWMQFDYVPGEFQMKKTSPDYSGRLCIIGVNLNKENLRKLLQI